MALLQLLYVSTATLEYGDAELDAILRASVRNNQRDGITGLLLYSQGTFMQVLEGEPDVVDAAYARICADTRHHGAIEMLREAIQQREFGEWSMGFRRLGAQDAQAHPQYAPLFQHGFDAARIGSRDGLASELMKQFVDRAR